MKTGIKPLKECNVLVTPTSFSKYNKNLANELESSVGKVIYNTTGKPLSEGDLIPLINDIDGFIAGLDNITSNVMKTARNLKIIARYGAGVDRVDLNAAKEYGIYVTNTPGTNSVSVAELTIGLAIAAARNIIEGSSDTKNGNWPRISGATLADKTFGIIGLGSIGKEVAKRLKTFNVKLVTYDVFFDESFLIQYDIRKTDLKELLTISDFISLHIPVTKETINIINKESLARMKKGSILINTARGELIDENALYESLASGHLKAAAIDTFKKEPPDKENKLLSLSQIITTPHMGAATDNASNDMTRISIEECLAVLKGEKPKYIVTGP